MNTNIPTTNQNNVIRYAYNYVYVLIFVGNKYIYV